MKKILEQFNFKKSARDLGVSIWQTPNFLFVVMGVIIAITIVILFYLTKDYSDPKILVLSECFVVIIMLTTGSNIIGRITDIAKINKLKTRFIELASSRLKDPLATVHWELELLLERTEGVLNEKQKERIDSIIESNENMISLVKDLLNVVRIEDNKKIEGQDVINMDQLLNEIIYSQKEYAKSRKITVEYDNQIPARLIKGNRRLIRIAIENVIFNAICFSPRERRVRISIVRRKGKLIIRVKDYGHGIPEEEKEYIFSKFFRASNILSHNIDGTGLGLYVTKKIVDGSSGRVWFKSKKDQGSEFFIEFPIFFSNEN
ncbi:MAG: HAMP domain-containing sensor histidine kinase [Patescibacteria group bacterium]|nr:HAMP domain-containing sensor histidine kinase [Patescibacteria group bacterium]